MSTSFDDFLATAWNDHGERPREVADRLAASLDRLTEPAHVPGYARIVTHVYGEHLGEWEQGVTLLRSLRELACYDDGAPSRGAIERGVAVLDYARGNALPAALSFEDRIVVLATASSTLAARGDVARALDAYDAAAAAAPDPAPGSPVARALAIGGNNLAATLEERADRDAAQTAGMVRAAEGGVKYWKLAGTWLEEERAYYRLARSLLAAQRAGDAVAAAERSAEICAANAAPPFERFFADAVRSQALRAAGSLAGADAARDLALAHYAALPPDERAWCEADRAALLT